MRNWQALDATVQINVWNNHTGAASTEWQWKFNENQASDTNLESKTSQFNSTSMCFVLILSYCLNCLGHLGAIRLLLLQNQLDMDAKNVFGFTPLMKAAIQGHIRCAKTLLFAGNFRFWVLIGVSIYGNRLID